MGKSVLEICAELHEASLAEMDKKIAILSQARQYVSEMLEKEKRALAAESGSKIPPEP